MKMISKGLKYPKVFFPIFTDFIYVTFSFYSTFLRAAHNCQHKLGNQYLNSFEKLGKSAIMP